jgi:hypothetical protein
MSTPVPLDRRKNDRSEIPVSFLPEGNPTARKAYLCAVIGLIPGLGLLCGPLAIILGILGRCDALRDEHQRGLGHAYVSRLLGGVEFACNAAGVMCITIAQGGLGRLGP